MPEKQNTPALLTDDEAKTLARNRKRVAPIDVSKLSEEEAKALEERREYNRKCAAKARKRSKDLVETLQKQVEDLTRDKTELERKNDVMRAQMDLLEQQNRALLLNQQQPLSADAANPFLLAQAVQGVPFLEALVGQSRLATTATRTPNAVSGSGGTRTGLTATIPKAKPGTPSAKDKRI